MIKMCRVNGIVDVLRFQSKIVYRCIQITGKIIECVLLADP